MPENSVIKQIKENKIYSVVRADCDKKALDTAKAFIDGGIKVVEITANYPAAFDVINEISQIDDIIVAAGSIITAKNAQKALEAGAKLIASPIFEVSLLKFCKERKTPLITGASTAKEAYTAWKTGIQMTKLFPVQAMGGVKYVRDILKPMPFLSLMPTGGVTMEDFMDYLDAGVPAVAMGSAFYENEDNCSIISKKVKEVLKKLNDRYKK